MNDSITTLKSKNSEKENKHMNKVISELKPKHVWRFFEEICTVPHPSKHEEKIRAYLKDFGEKFGLKAIETKIGNIIFRKPASVGCENKPIVTLQAHMDMVPAKTDGSDHDFVKDSIKPYIDGGWVKAKNTTLGADNGIGLAMILAVLSDDSIKHGPIEALITVDEETGMTGAFGLEEKDLIGEILLNLDSEEDDEVCIGCAGGLDTNISLGYHKDLPPKNTQAFKLSISGLFSGHSGMDIPVGRANALKEMANCLYIANDKFNISLASINGGTFRNVIAARCDAVILVAKQQVNDFIQFIDNFNNNLQIEFANVDKDIVLEINEMDSPEYVIDKDTHVKLILALQSCFNGVLRMNNDLGIAHSSSNLGAIHTLADKIEIVALHRSPLVFAKEKVANMIKASFELIGAKVEQTGAYPGWQPDPESNILQLIKNSYRKLYKEDIKVAATHGGLECGLLLEKFPHMQAVSIGVTIRDPHSVNEKVNIASVEKGWNFLVEVLENIE